MKNKINRKELLNNDDIWNAVISVISKFDYPTDNHLKNEVYTLFHYYSEMESGGHESLFTWVSELIDKVGIDHYLEELIGALEKIGAHEYARIVKSYGGEIWILHNALENNEIDENKYYTIVEMADKEHYKLNEKLGSLLETYFVSIHTELIDVIDE